MGVSGPANMRRSPFSSTLGACDLDGLDGKPTVNALMEGDGDIIHPERYLQIFHERAHDRHVRENNRQ
jgi:hypothetical protein